MLVSLLASGWTMFCLPNDSPLRRGVFERDTAPSVNCSWRDSVLLPSLLLIVFRLPPPKPEDACGGGSPCCRSLLLEAEDRHPPVSDWRDAEFSRGEIAVETCGVDGADGDGK